MKRLQRWLMMATQGNPWLIEEVHHHLSTGEIQPPISQHDKIPVILNHISRIHDFYGNKLGTQLSRKHIFWYSMRLDQKKARDFWPKINRVSDHSEQYFIFRDYLHSL